MCFCIVLSHCAFDKSNKSTLKAVLYYLRENTFTHACCSLLSSDISLTLVTTFIALSSLSLHVMKNLISTILTYFLTQHYPLEHVSNLYFARMLWNCWLTFESLFVNAHTFLKVNEFTGSFLGHINYGRVALTRRHAGLLERSIEHWGWASRQSTFSYSRYRPPRFQWHHREEWKVGHFKQATSVTVTTSFLF